MRTSFGNSYIEANHGEFWIEQEANSDMIFKTNDTERMRIYGDGHKTLQSTAGIGLTITQAAASNGLFLNQDGNGQALNIDSEATSATVLNVTAENTSGNIMNIDSKLVMDYLGNVGIGTTAPDTKLDVAGAITTRELSSDPADPDEGANVQWQSDGTGSGDDGDILVKINVGGTVKITTLVDFSEI